MTKIEFIERYGEEAYQRYLEQRKQYREQHKEEIKQYREKNKEYQKQYQIQYREQHKEEIKQYREKNKEYQKQYQIQYREQHKEEIKEYYQQHKEEIKQWYRNNRCMFAYCIPEQIEQIENYELAKADDFQGWHCHHRLETHRADGTRREVDLSREELIAMDMYYNRPASELIFMRAGEHISLHRKGGER